MFDDIKDFPEHTPRPDKAPLALQGIRVLEIAHFLAAPFATMILADMGADVVKIEPPVKGDDYRQYPPVVPEIQGGLFFGPTATSAAWPSI